jgi:hypothetical protein
MSPADPPAEGGGKFPPYHEDFLHNIIGVHWGGAEPPDDDGLAVEFYRDDE